MTEILIASKDGHANEIRELFSEYLQWANTQLKQEFGIQFDVLSIIEDDMQHLEKFMPPAGRLLLAYEQSHPAGIACLKVLPPEMGEIKRMYVRPQYRGRGIGRALLSRLLDEARQIGYRRVRLDSARFMKEAHHVYQSAGFREIEAYEGSEIPGEFQQHWIFMEITLPPA